MRSVRLPQALLILAAFLAVVFGGYVASDQTVVGPDGLLSAMGEGQAPILQHALIALPVFLALCLLLVGRRVQQVPHPYVASALMLVVVGLAPAVAVSSYRAVSVNAWIEWLAYAVAYLAAVSGLGRRVGPPTLLAAVFVGGVWVALRGVLEYGGMRGIDPTWRVFAGWSNPNATAAMLTLAFFCGLSLLDSKERLVTLGAVVGGGLILFAIFLTGSKGATLFALPLGMVAYTLVLNPKSRVLRAVAILAIPLVAFGFLKSITLLPGALMLFILGGLRGGERYPSRVWSTFGVGLALVTLLSFSAPKSGTAGPVGVTPGSRIAAPSTTQDQSATFRLNLWKSAAILAEQRPVTGWGLGSYRYESARPGLVTATVFSHNSYLQLAAEAGLVPLLLFGAFLVLWVRRTLRGCSSLPPESRSAFAAAFGGVVAALVHCTVDSDLSYFGLGLAFFLVLGAATNLAADAVAPEFIPKPSRFVAAAGVALAGLIFLYLGGADLAKSQVRFAQEAGAPADVTSIESLAGWDGDAAYLWAMAQSDPESALKAAFALQPTPKVARSLARVQERKGDFVAAEAALFPALAHDPNNLKALYLLMQLRREAQDVDGAVETALRLVAVEQEPVFKIRSLDQVVPTETYLARIEVLAPAETNNVRRATLLAEGVHGLRKYADVTLAAILNAIKTDPNGNYAGERLPDAKDKLAIGVNAARAAAKLYRDLGDAKAAAEMTDQAVALEKAAG